MSSSQSIQINGLPLPRGLLDLIAVGRWCCPDNLSKVDHVFPDRSELKLYSLDYMPFENKAWAEETDPMFLGASDETRSPGDINPRQSVLIGDLGIGYDQPIALDYRVSYDEPCVLTLQWSVDGKENRWVEIAANIEQLAEILGL